MLNGAGTEFRYLHATSFAESVQAMRDAKSDRLIYHSRNRKGYEIADLSCLQEFPNIRILSVSRLHIVGEDALSNCLNLHTLNLDDCQFDVNLLTACQTGNTAQSTPDGLAAHLLAYFPPSCTEIL